MGIEPRNFSSLTYEDVSLYQVNDQEQNFPDIGTSEYYRTLKALIRDSGHGKRHLPDPPDDIPVIGDPDFAIQGDQVVIGPHDFELKYWQDHFCLRSRPMFPITRYIVTNEDGKNWTYHKAEDFFKDRGIDYHWDNHCGHMHIMTLLFDSEVDEGANVPVIYPDGSWKVEAADKNGTQPIDLPDPKQNSRRGLSTGRNGRHHYGRCSDLRGRSLRCLLALDS